MEIYSLGIDPGWKNLGIAIVKQDEEGRLSVLKSGVLNPSETEAEYGSRWAFNRELDTWIGDTKIELVGIERYVSYQGIDTSESENILLTIGLLGLYSHGLTGGSPFLYRAFDWKKELCQYLVKEKGFTNPSTSFDKKYSIAAAKACLDYSYMFKTDHEADSIAIAATNIFRRNAKRRENKR
jgi:Holliday junction resolvasome RuvABC endonuclease subunit